MKIQEARAKTKANKTKATEAATDVTKKNEPEKDDDEEEDDESCSNSYQKLWSTDLAIY